VICLNASGVARSASSLSPFLDQNSPATRKRHESGVAAPRRFRDEIDVEQIARSG
jgi:hypothetical protein